MSTAQKTAASDRVSTTAPAQLFERPEGGERAVLVQLDDASRQYDEALDELAALAESAGARVVEYLVNRRDRPDPRYFLGRGKVAELRERLQYVNADLVLVNHTLTPGQERNLEQALGCRVLDRTELILDIFALRARTHEGKLQVELAQLRHIASRLVRGWSHLERQKGGIGLRGPGETQLEMDKRMLGQRIKQLEKRLERVRCQRRQGRQARRKRDFPAVSLVGYTNAGKSTLFNRLAGSGVYAADQLFATLDTTLRRIALPGAEPAVFADTVGFISDLPHQLVAAFRSTLEEVVEANLLVHIIDASAGTRDEQRGEVETVLEEIGADEVPVLRVYNKIDLLGRPSRVERDKAGRPVAVWVSAATGEGLEWLLAVVAECVGERRAHGRVHLEPSQGRLRALLYQSGEVLGEQIHNNGDCVLEVSLPQRELERLQHHEGLPTSIEYL